MPNFATNPSRGLPTLRRGARGLFVAYCQNLINARLRGQPAMWVDGLFGTETDTGVRRFQRARQLAADGVVGPLTWAALEAGPPPIQRRPVGQAAVSVPATGGV